MSKPTGAIFGSGVAGLSAAHELAERGFAVAGYERQPVYVGGKARSTQVPGTATPKRPALGRGGRWVPLAGLPEGAAGLLAGLVAFTPAG